MLKRSCKLNDEIIFHSISYFSQKQIVDVFFTRRDGFLFKVYLQEAREV